MNSPIIIDSRERDAEYVDWLRSNQEVQIKLLESADIILKTAVADPKMVHLAKITAAFEFSVLTLTVPGLRAEISKSFVLLTSCTILVLLNCRF